MYEQPGMSPSDPRRHTPPMPPAPPAPPPAPGYAPAPGYYAPPPPPPGPSRTWLWVTLGVAGGALVVGTGAFALSGSDGDGGSRTANAAPVAANSTGGSGGGGTGGAGAAPGRQAPAPAGGGAGGNAGAGQPLKRLQYPATFQGLTRSDNFPGLADIQRIVQSAAAPEAEVKATGYLGGSFGEKHLIVIGATMPRPITPAERQQELATAFQPNPMDVNKTVYGPAQTFDPGPAGGDLRCATSTTKLAQPDALGNTMYGGVQCIVLGVNTELTVTESEELSGLSTAKAADDLRKLRAVAEVPR